MVQRRKFPGPWQVERTAGNHFVVKDANMPPLLTRRCQEP